MTNTATWTAVDAIGGYVVTDTIHFDFEDISTTGTAFTLGDDAVGSRSRSASASTSTAWATPTSASARTASWPTPATQQRLLHGRALPDPTTPNGVIAGWWEDLDPRRGGSRVYYETLGTAPNQCFIVQFTDVQHFP